MPIASFATGRALLSPRRRNLPLDDYTGASGAYSVRRVRAAYVGALIRLRRESDDAEADFNVGFDGVVDRTAINAWLSGSNGFGVSFYDQSGNGRDMGQTTKANQPLWVDSAPELGGRPGFLFNGTTQFFSRAQDVLGTGSTPCTISSVARRDDDSAGTLFSAGNTNGGGRPTLGTNPSSVGSLNYSGGAAASATNAWLTSTGTVIMGRCTGANNILLLAGTQVSVAAAVLNTGATSANIGARVGSTSFFKGVIPEVLVWQNATVDWLGLYSEQKAFFRV